MNATRILHTLGQSLWVDNITRSLLKTGRLRHYIDEFSVAGLTSNPTIFDHAINSGDYDDAIRSKLGQGKSGEKLFIELALEDLKQAADLFRPVYERTCGVDGWVSLEVSPLLAHDTKSTIAAAEELHAEAQCPNLSIGTKDPKASDVLYVKALAAPFTVNTMPEGTLQALAEHGEVGTTMPADGGNSEEELARFAGENIVVEALSTQLQDEGAKSFVNSWNDLMGVISSKSAVLKQAS